MDWACARWWTVPRAANAQCAERVLNLALPGGTVSPADLQALASQPLGPAGLRFVKLPTALAQATVGPQAPASVKEVDGASSVLPCAVASHPLARTHVSQSVIQVR